MVIVSKLLLLQADDPRKDSRDLILDFIYFQNFVEHQTILFSLFE